MMDRLFLDANVLFSAAYRSDAGLLQLWKIPGVTLCASHYAIGEARVNLAEREQRDRLAMLTNALQIFDATHGKLPQEISLPEKDVPIMLAAMEAPATHLLTGDVRHFARYFRKKIGGVLILLPGEYLRVYRGR
jgi:predicted nucleic acid-binding protein